MSRLEKNRRERAMLQLIREYHEVTVEELADMLQSHRMVRDKSESELEHFVMHGYWPETSKQEAGDDIALADPITREER